MPHQPTDAEPAKTVCSAFSRSLRRSSSRPSLRPGGEPVSCDSSRLEGNFCVPEKSSTTACVTAIEVMPLTLSCGASESIDTQRASSKTEHSSERFQPARLHYLPGLSQGSRWLDPVEGEDAILPRVFGHCRLSRRALSPSALLVRSHARPCLNLIGSLVLGRQAETRVTTLFKRLLHLEGVRAAREVGGR